MALALAETGQESLLEQNVAERRIEALESALAEMRERQGRLEDELRLFRRVAQTVPVGIVLADANGKIIYGNEVLAEMVRHPVRHSQDPESYLEWESYHADGSRVQAHEYPLAQVLKEGAQRTTLDVHYKRGDGSMFWMHIIGEQVIDDEGEMAGAIVAVIDIDAEIRLREHQKAMIGELNHRVKNAFTVSQSIVARLLRIANTDPSVIETIDRRLKVYAAAHARMTGSDWARVPLTSVVADVLEPMCGDRLEVHGEGFSVPARTALALSTAFYELGRNAIEHGALRSAEGRIHLWLGGLETSIDGPRYRVKWMERGGPAPSGSRTNGFGTFVSGRALAMETGGSVETDYAADGFEWNLTMPPPYRPGDSE